MDLIRPCEEHPDKAPRECVACGDDTPSHYECEMCRVLLQEFEDAPGG